MKLDMEGRRRLSRLLDQYGRLLTDRQRLALSLHLEKDWSYAEIAAFQGVSRPAAYDLVRRSRAALEGYEARLQLLGLADHRAEEAEALRQRLRGVESELQHLRQSVKGMS
jgi:predicted DNA-binding protein YlxM (UPF0122 family)